MGERLTTPCLRQDPEGLLHRRAATAHVRSKAGVLHVRPSEPEPECQSTVTQQLDRRCILSEAQRVVHRRQHDTGANLDP